MVSSVMMRAVGRSAGTAALVIWSLALASATQAPAADVRRPGVCVREGAKLVRAVPVQTGRGVRLPKKLHDVHPAYPHLPSGTTGSGNWHGEFLLDTGGRVVEVWPTREPQLRPPFPKFNEAIVHAIRQWRFEPVIVGERPVPACSTVSILINWS